MLRSFLYRNRQYSCSWENKSDKPGLGLVQVMIFSWGIPISKVFLFPKAFCTNETSLYGITIEA